MPDSDRPTPERLPIKLILPNQAKERPVQGGGSRPAPFRQVDQAYRTSLSKQVAALQQSIVPLAGGAGVAPARVKLHQRAIAKSHRPTRLFSEESCPIIGAGSLGEIFVKATKAGLDVLTREIKRSKSDQVVKELSTVTSIEPVTPELRRRGQTALDVVKRSPRVKSGGFLTRVRLFDFGRQGDQERIVTDFMSVCTGRRLKVLQDGYSPRSFVYSVECGTADDVEALSRTVGVRSVAGMPLLKTIRPNAANPRPLPPGLPRSDGLNGDFPVVAVVDSGIASVSADLETWIVGRESTVAPVYQNPSHGTFVAGLLCWGYELNPTLADIDGQPCGAFDLQVIPNWDPAHGSTENVTEQEFLQTLESALQQHANRIKVWNLSLGTDEVCSLDEFSAFAEQLDNLQEQYQVSFVISAGNYQTPPLLEFPRTAAQMDSGRITSPADSVLGITVGAISHIGYPQNGPKQDEVSPFSRHGAGPNYIVKPDLVHYGGTCSTDGRQVAGICSVVGSGVGDDLGTSFAAPLVARSLAQIYHQITPAPSSVLARALLTHHARDPRTRSRVPDGDENFFGFGRPAPPPYSIACEPHMSTLVFDDVLRPGFFQEWDDFPYPPSLKRGGKFYGEVWMTIAFAPSRGARWGAEYCETHVEAHFGVYRHTTNRKTHKVSETFEGLVPPEHKNPGKLYEDVQVRELRKWAPVRTYHGDLSKGVRGLRWRLKVQLLTRHGVEDTEAARSQPFSLIVTIADPEKRAPIYDEMAQIIHARFQSQNLGIRAVARIQART